MPKKLFIRTFGCQMNEYDSDKMAALLREAKDFEITDRPEDADLILFNTCSVRERAQEKVFHDLGRVKHLKQARRDLLIGVGGCVASQEGAAIVARAPYVDLVFGPQTLHRLPELIDARQSSGRPQVDVSFPEIEKFDRLPPVRVEGPSAFVSIMEGCSKYCSFCVVPYTRGEEVSRPFDDVLTEIADLADQGVKEVTLLGQNVNAYRGRMADGVMADLALLLEYVAELPGIGRIRYTTSHPKEFTQRLIDAHARIEKLAPHVHLPVQSGADRVLAAMKRGYTSLEYKSIIRKLRAAKPGISISSDFIIGFPGETEQDFEATLKLVDEVGFDDSFSFIYSRRPGTPAAELADDTPQAVKASRLARLKEKIDGHATRISERRIGTRQRILVEGVSRRHAGELSGRAGDNRMINFRGSRQLVGQFVEVTVTAAMTHSLRGDVCAAA
ncbi:MAG TPA: tRNA (N6-isopentenyl adenosine(37)-C2)-methylthiotransferase MiaB [Burkholderiales bacterium]|nr:tRNA (N6-isopentenyl adenosine(37)-C2)-methylthiotransferase MiaB [Burkholderiales bacterium]